MFRWSPSRGDLFEVVQNEQRLGLRLLGDISGEHLTEDRFLGVPAQGTADGRVEILAGRAL